jgi:hypothetical protein
MDLGTDDLFASVRRYNNDDMVPANGTANISSVSFDKCVEARLFRDKDSYLCVLASWREIPSRALA